MKHLNSVITGTGSYIPTVRVTNREFTRHTFYNEDETKIETLVDEVIAKFKDITGIEERRWVSDDLCASDIGAIAARRAIEDAGVDPETIDQIIVAHNFGDIKHGTIQTDILPSLASRIKHHLGIKNPSCIPYDLIFGCPGWVQGVIQADSYIKSGLAKRCLVIGTDTLSRLIDKHDRDCMIFADGAGAVVIEAKEEEAKRGILSAAAMSHTEEEAFYLYLGKSYHPESDPNIRYIKMEGRKIYEYALINVPEAMKVAVENAGVEPNEITKILIHQANEKMDEAIVKRFVKKCRIEKSVPELMPMSIRELGNSSVGTIPTLYDMIIKGKQPEHKIDKDDIVMFASVGAGMNINAVVYKH
ncbi:3-oxoacyl-ACP synthase III family protein [Tenuifilum thalassicum]|uniref:Ketoacyl-ACP synthase III n=1 Tax=Tenuifilum thalassicum TaxID=2590900 RepID=A0A7D3XWM9_9BACT|nr:ketoacyl-ACP synthase III [Tenuifilum thalassicum]QKG80531.1 ketoacyl-ACP synthase III [Tenuifilum thalassicum]